VNLIEDFEKKNPVTYVAFLHSKNIHLHQLNINAHGDQIHSLGLELSSISWLGSNRALLRLDSQNNLDMSKF
jgi:hypothetical protein